MTIVSTSSAPLVDAFNRRITYLRLSVTDRCDLRCTYCMPEKMTFLPRKDVLSLEELHKLALGFIDRGITKIRLTGGEPLVRRREVEPLHALGRETGGGQVMGRHTTDGSRCGKLYHPHAPSGVRGDYDLLLRRVCARRLALTPRGSRIQTIRGIAAAREAGLKVKLNTVALKGMNEEEIPFLIEWAHSQGHDITLIETMPLGEVEEDRVDHYLPLPVIRDELEKRWTLVPSDATTGGPSRYVDVAETGGRLGFITPLTNNFCAGCNRIRVTATGQLYACLGGSEKVDLRAALRSDEPERNLAEALDLLMQIKPERHHFRIERGAGPAQPRHMSLTGG